MTKKNNFCSNYFSATYLQQLHELMNQQLLLVFVFFRTKRVMDYAENQFDVQKQQIIRATQIAINYVD